MVFEYFKLDPNEIQVEPFAPLINSECFSFELGITRLSVHQFTTRVIHRSILSVTLFCSRIAPRPTGDASVTIRVGRPGVKYAITGAPVKQDLTSLNAFSSDLVHFHSTSPVRFHNGLVIDAKV